MTTRKFISRQVLLAVLVGVAACGSKSTPEEECLQSDRLSFKDPDSLKLVANLGDRGASPNGKGSFWLRYSATNSYGARTSANMACSLSVDGHWSRSESLESTAVSDLYIVHGEGSGRDGGEQSPCTSLQRLGLCNGFAWAIPLARACRSAGR